MAFAKFLLKLSDLGPWSAIPSARSDDFSDFLFADFRAEERHFHARNRMRRSVPHHLVLGQGCSPIIRSFRMIEGSSRL